MQEAIGKLEGAALGDMLDFLSKELVRFQVSWIMGNLHVCSLHVCYSNTFTYMVESYTTVWVILRDSFSSIKVAGWTSGPISTLSRGSHTARLENV